MLNLNLENICSLIYSYFALFIFLADFYFYFVKIFYFNNKFNQSNLIFYYLILRKSFIFAILFTYLY